MRKSKLKIEPWVTAPISLKCELFVPKRLFGTPSDRSPIKVECGQPTRCAYPAAGKGWMALCAQHGAKHIEITTGIVQLKINGEKFA